MGLRKNRTKFQPAQKCRLLRVKTHRYRRIDCSLKMWIITVKQEKRCKSFQARSTSTYVSRKWCIPLGPWKFRPYKAKLIWVMKKFGQWKQFRPKKMSSSCSLRVRDLPGAATKKRPSLWSLGVWTRPSLFLRVVRRIPPNGKISLKTTCYRKQWPKDSKSVARARSLTMLVERLP